MLNILINVLFIVLARTLSLLLWLPMLAFSALMAVCAVFVGVVALVINQCCNIFATKRS